MNPSRKHFRDGGAFVQRGVTLVELMVALVLGLSRLIPRQAARA